QETHIGPADTNVLPKLQGFKIFSTKYNGRSRGVAILIRETVVWEYVWHHEDFHGRSLILTCKLHGQLYTFVNVYNPAKDKHLLDGLKIKLKHSPVLVIGGDFNTALEPELDRTATKKNAQHNALRKCVDRLRKRFELEDIWRTMNPQKREYTFCRGVRESRLDYFFMQENSVSLVQSCEIRQTEISDHDPVCLNLYSGGVYPPPEIDPNDRIKIKNHVESKNKKSGPNMARINLPKKDVSFDSKGRESGHGARGSGDAAGEPAHRESPKSVGPQTEDISTPFEKLAITEESVN
ncbi:hypothetical protein COCON_G00129720, partial [Conger conger]